jgi:hypothetical protein
MRRLLFTLTKIPDTHSVTGSIDPRVIVRLEGLFKLKSPVTSLRIELGTFRLVA